MLKNYPVYAYTCRYDSYNKLSKFTKVQSNQSSLAHETHLLFKDVFYMYNMCIHIIYVSRTSISTYVFRLSILMLYNISCIVISLTVLLNTFPVFSTSRLPCKLFLILVVGTSLFFVDLNSFTLNLSDVHNEHNDIIYKTGSGPHQISNMFLCNVNYLVNSLTNAI